MISASVEQRIVVKNPHNWTERISYKCLYWHSKCHWKWPKLHGKDHNMRWILVFYVWSRNQASIHALEVPIITENEKSSDDQVKIQSNDLHWVPEGQTINQHYYLEVLAKLREKIRKKRRELWESKSWVLHHDNAPAHTALSVKTFLAKHSIPVLDHPPYSPDLAPCDFYLFPKVKSALKGTRFQSVEAVKEKAAQVLKELTEEDFRHCFAQWKIRMERCRDRGGVYIEGDNN